MPPREESASVTKPVSGASHCLNELRWKFIVDLSPQSSHQNLEHVRERVVVLIPDVSGDCRAIDDLSLVQDKKLEQRKLLCCELYGFAGATHPLRLQIDFQVGNAQRLGEWSAAPSSQRPHAREELTERKGLGEVIVRAYLEAGHPVVDSV